MAQDRINEVYRGELFSDRARMAARARIGWICERVEGNRVLDVGCSQGIISILLARQGKIVTGIDVNKESIDYALNEAVKEDEEIRARLNFIHGDFQDYGFESESFDTVILGQVLEHVSNPTSLLEVTWRLCKPDGRVIVTTPFGFLDHPDHKHTYYLSSFSVTVAPFFQLEDLEIVYKRICFAGSPRENIASSDSDAMELINIHWLGEINKLSEVEFGYLEREHISKFGMRYEILEKQEERLENHEIHLEKLQNEIIKKTNQIAAIKSSIRYRIGNAFVRAAKPSRDTLALPVRLFRLFKEWRRKKREANKEVYSEKDRLSRPKRDITIPKVIEKVNSLRMLFVPTNGAGLGHLTRLLAIARRMKFLQGVSEIVFLTTSNALNLINQEGFVPYHFPSTQSLRNSLTSGQWNKAIQASIQDVISNHDINALIFDGTFPYSGIRQAIKKNKKLRTVWIRRGMLKKGIEERLKDFESLFELVVVPGEMSKSTNQPWQETNSKEIHIPPIVFLGEEELLPRENVQEMLELDREKKTVFVQLGAGNINDIIAMTEIIINTLKGFDQIQIVLAESMIAKRGHMRFTGVKIIRDYPLSRYYNGFDFAISAAGYNSFSELIFFRVPTIFIPNMATKSDDQFARASIANRENAGVVLQPFSIQNLKSHITTLFDSDKNKTFRNNCSALRNVNGADAVTDILMKLVSGDEEADKLADR